MDFFERPEEVAQQLSTAQRDLRQFEENVSNAQLLGRLRAAHPLHPALLARTLFIVLTLLSLLAAVAVGALPFIHADAAQSLADIERGIGLPMPLVLGISAMCMAIAWVMAGQAALTFARDCAMMPWEQKEHERLTNEMKRLASQKAIMDRVHGTPMGARPRLGTPVPATGYAARYSAPGAPARSSGNQLNYAYGGSGGAYGPTTPRTDGPRGRTPLGATPRPGTPVGKLRSATSTPTDPQLSYAAPADAGNAPDLLQGAADIVEKPGASWQAAEGGSFEQRHGKDFPEWGAVDEPWLEDAIQKSELLAGGFPVQARLAYSLEANVPFALILERATPAMAVRAMVSFVEFLASIAVPPRARIVLRSVPHLDRSFHRNVEAALDPYFSEKFEVERKGDQIEITFLEPDPAWKAYPKLPINS